MRHSEAKLNKENIKHVFCDGVRYSNEIVAIKVTTNKSKFPIPYQFNKHLSSLSLFASHLQLHMHLPKERIKLTKDMFEDFLTCLDTVKYTDNREFYITKYQPALKDMR
jgi:hypothetical protein